jgi:hypothetical protein
MLGSMTATHTARNPLLTLLLITCGMQLAAAGPPVNGEAEPCPGASCWSTPADAGPATTTREPPAPLAFEIGIDGRHSAGHGSDLATGPDFTTFRSTISALGVDLITLTSFEASDLEGLGALLLHQPNEAGGPSYSQSEIEAVHAFVAGGGNLLVHGEGGWASDDYTAIMNQLVAPWGVSYAGSATEGSGHVITGFEPHPITSAITSFGIDFQRRLSIAAPAIDLSIGSGADDFLAAVDAEGGQGCVALISDASCWKDAGSGSDHPITFGDNQALIVNIINHFMSKQCTPDCRATAVIEGPLRICEGEQVELSAAGSSLNGCAGGIEYRWLRNDVEIYPYPGPESIMDSPAASSSYRVEVRCSDEPTCEAGTDHAVEVQVDEPPPPMGNVLRAVKQPDGILFSWGTAAFDTHLRRHEDKRFDRPSSQLLASEPGQQFLAEGELSRPPEVVYYRAFAASCGGTEEL